jgi:hypothetical protein
VTFNEIYSLLLNASASTVRHFGMRAIRLIAESLSLIGGPRWIRTINQGIMRLKMFLLCRDSLFLIVLPDALSADGALLHFTLKSLKIPIFSVHENTCSTHALGQRPPCGVLSQSLTGSYRGPFFLLRLTVTLPTLEPRKTEGPFR